MVNFLKIAFGFQSLKNKQQTHKTHFRKLLTRSYRNILKHMFIFLGMEIGLVTYKRKKKVEATPSPEVGLPSPPPMSTPCRGMETHPPAPLTKVQATPQPAPFAGHGGVETHPLRAPPAGVGGGDSPPPSSEGVAAAT